MSCHRMSAHDELIGPRMTYGSGSGGWPPLLWPRFRTPHSDHFSSVKWGLFDTHITFAFGCYRIRSTPQPGKIIASAMVRCSGFSFSCRNDIRSPRTHSRACASSLIRLLGGAEFEHCCTNKSLSVDCLINNRCPRTRSRAFATSLTSVTRSSIVRCDGKKMIPLRFNNLLTMQSCSVRLHAPLIAASRTHSFSLQSLMLS
jgi:hypothetical protein